MQLHTMRMRRKKKQKSKSGSKSDVQTGGEDTYERKSEKTESTSPEIKSESAIPYIEQTCISSNAPWMPTKIMADYYTRFLNGFSQNMLAASDLAKKLTLLNIELIKQLNQSTKVYS